MEFVLGAIAGAILSAIASWAVNYFVPGLWRTLARKSPVHVHVETDPSVIHAGAPDWDPYLYVVERRLEDIGEPPTSVAREWRNWIWGDDVFDADRTEIQVTLVGASDSTVVIDGLRVRTLRREHPQGLAIACPVGGASASPRRIEVNLDWAPGVIKYLDAGDEPTEAFVFSLAKGEVETFFIEASVTRDAVEWLGELLLLVDGKRQKVDIGDGDRPFRTSTTEGLPVFVWGEDGWTQS